MHGSRIAESAFRAAANKITFMEHGRKTSRLRADLIEVYKIVNGFFGVSFYSFFEYDTNEKKQGHSRKLCKKRFNVILI